jgi:hypothetical protein
MPQTAFRAPKNAEYMPDLRVADLGEGYLKVAIAQMAAPLFIGQWLLRNF